jgi:hypothetical protein
MPPASAFWHPVSQSCTGLVRHRNFCSFRYRLDWMPKSLAFRHKNFAKLKRNTMHVYSPTFRHLKKLSVVVVHVQTVGSGKLYTLHVHRQLLMVLWFFSIMTECPQKVSPASAFLPVVSFLSPVSGFSPVRCRWSRIGPRHRYSAC